MQVLVIAITLLFYCCYSANSYAQNKVYWFSDILEDSAEMTQATNTHVSTLTDTTRLLMKSLPQYQFSTEFAESPSIARLLKKLPNSCAPNRIKTPERLKDNLYSFPINIYLGLRLYYRKGEEFSILPKNSLDNDKRL